MTVPNKHGLYFIGIGPTTLGGIKKQAIALKSEIKGDASSGEIFTRFLALYDQSAAPGFSTKSIKAALDACGCAGLSLAGLTGGFCMYAQKHADGAGRAAGAVHKRYKMVKGIMAPKTLSVDHRGDAVLEYDVVVTYDGANDPIVISDAVALPAGVADAGCWTLGKTTIGGHELSGKRQLRIDFGLDVVAESADSDIWDTFASIRRQQSTITLRGIDVNWFSDSVIPLRGVACSHDDTKIYLRKRALGSSFVSDATAQHISITACGMAAIDNPLDADPDKATETSLTLPCRFDDTNAPLVINTATAIS